MALPHPNHAAAFEIPLHQHAYYPMSVPARVDSPLDNMTISRGSDLKLRPVPDDVDILPIRSTGPRNERPARRSQTNSSEKKGGTATLRFFVVDHPTKLKDKEQMRENRKHVMYDYLDKERRKPTSTDARVAGSACAARKRTRLDARGSAANSHSPAKTIFSPKQPLLDSVEVLNDASHDAERDDLISSQRPTAGDSNICRAACSVAASRDALQHAENEAPLVRGVPRAFTKYPYLRTPLEEIPNPAANPGSAVNPFDSWPKFMDSTINLQELKWNCSRKFGSHGIAQHWIPQLLKAKHAFLSTICISTSHDDIMMRSIQEPRERQRHGSTEQIRIRGEVISMVNQAMVDPKQATADATIVSVLHLLSSEIMGCDDTVMAIHQQGILQMVDKRGGLSRLGLDGRLAGILAITNYLISAMRESEPHRTFVKYAAFKQLRPPTTTSQFPESPIFCRMSGYCKINKTVSPGSPTFELLETLRLLTNSFVRSSAETLLSPVPQARPGKSAMQDAREIRSLYGSIFATKAAEQRPDDFSSMGEKYTFEALRLTAVVYAHALANKVPFSKAAAQLSASHCNQQIIPWHQHIQHALSRTDLSSCWGDLAGVLFWASLIASASAVPAPYPTPSPSNAFPCPASPIDAAATSDAEDSRKWLAAVAVRCKIILAFEYGASVLGTLKRLVGIEQALAQAERERMAEMGTAVVVAAPQMPAEKELYYGPAEAPFVQRTFQDFAQDFNESL